MAKKKAVEHKVSFFSEKTDMLGTEEFSTLVTAEKEVTKVEKNLAQSREKRDCATTDFLKSIGAYPLPSPILVGGKFKIPDRTNMVRDWAQEFFGGNWPQTPTYPGGPLGPASLNNSAVAELFEEVEYTALKRADAALKVAISKACKKAEEKAKLPKSEPPKSEPPKSEPPKSEPPKSEPPKSEDVVLSALIEQAKAFSDFAKKAKSLKEIQAFAKKALENLQQKTLNKAA